MSQGELVIIYVAAANRDPAVFAEPNTFDIERDNAGKHLAFSGGRTSAWARRWRAPKAKSDCGRFLIASRRTRRRRGQPPRHPGAAWLVHVAGGVGPGQVDGYSLTAFVTPEVALQRHGADQLAVAIEHGALGKSATTDAAG